MRNPKELITGLVATVAVLAGAGWWLHLAVESRPEPGSLVNLEVSQGINPCFPLIRAPDYPRLIRSSRSKRFYSENTGSDLFVFDAQRQQVFKIPQSFALSWDPSSDKLYFLHNDHILSFLDGRIQAETVIDDYFHRNANLSNAPAVRTLDAFENYYASRYGLFVVFDRERSLLSIFDLQKSRGAQYQVRSDFKGAVDRVIGWDHDRGAPFVALTTHFPIGSGGQDLRRQLVISLINSRGERYFEAKTFDEDIKIKDHFQNGVLSIINWQGNNRCVSGIDNNGHSRNFGHCDPGLKDVQMSKSGAVLTQQFYARSDPNVYFADGHSGSMNSDMGPGSPDTEDRIFFYRDIKGAFYASSSETYGGRAIETMIAPSSCPGSAPARMMGAPLVAHTRDGLTTHGYLFLPRSTRPIGVLVMLHGGPYITAYEDALPAGGFASFALNRGYAIVLVNYSGTMGYGRSYVEQGFHHALQRPVIDALALRDEAFKVLGISRGKTILSGESFGGYLVAKSLVEGDTWYDAAMINEGICDWTTRPEKARGANGYHAFREFIEADNILYSLRLSSGPGGAYPDGDLCRRKIQRDIPVVFVHAAEDNIAPMDEIMGFSNRQRAMNRRITFLKFAGLPPPGHFNLMDGVPMWFDQKSADQVFNQIFHDLESDTVAR